MSTQRFLPNSFIKNIALQIREDYDMQNNPFPIDTDDPKRKTADAKKQPTGFIGRKQHSAKFHQFLQSKSKKGIFLVTGFRGMGKTSFVNVVLDHYKKNPEKNGEILTERARRKRAEAIIPIHLTLTQNNPKEIDILRLMVTSINDQYPRQRINWVLLITQILMVPVILGAIILATILFRTDAINVFYPGVKSIPESFHALCWCTGGVALFLVIYVGLKKYHHHHEKKMTPERRIKHLTERCYSVISEENSNNDEISFQGINARILGNSEKTIKQSALATTKEIEYELQGFLKEANKEFIFIFDELDKVEPTVGALYFYDDADNKDTANSYERRVRDRKQAVINIIAGLKNFFTTAEARFIFIAGREMFDASLADVADRQASVSSIFTYVFNIESFLKEKDIREGDSNKNNASLSYATEEYLKGVLFGQNIEDSLFKSAVDKYTGYNFSDRGFVSFGKDEPEFVKLYFILQKFVTYLTYRSNGSPKKMIKEIQELIILKPGKDSFDSRTIVFEETNSNSNLYLYFNYDNQYRFGFINYLYRPFLIKYGRSFKLFSDNIIQSTPYLFDHLLKFHPFAFSLSNLELIPEILSANKTPALRDHINKIIEHLTLNHLREIEIGLFNYKFFSRTLNEISYLSKIFEQEGAGLNFTLDESYLVKIHVRDKIKELRYNYQQLNTDLNVYQQVFSITHLNHILGDLHFFDQEYNDAILAYQDAIKPVDMLPVATIDISDFVTLVRIKLKLGLCFEKINSFDSASALYSECTRDTVQFIYNFQTVLRETGEGKNLHNSTLRNFDKSFLQEIMPLIIQGFLAKMIIKEKMRFSGVRDFTKDIYNVSKMINFVNEEFNKPTIVHANLLLHAGNLAYFKNTLGKNKGDQITAAENAFELSDAGRSTFLKDLEKLENRKGNFNVKSKLRRKPLFALHLYLLGICATIDSRKSPSDERTLNLICKDKNIISDLLESIIKDKENFLLRGLDHRYLAYFLSNIGDCLLAMYQHKEKDKYSNFKVYEIFDLESKEAVQNEPDLLRKFQLFLKQPITQEDFSFKDILLCYYLSGEFFIKHGRAISGSFQFRKIMHVLRIILTKGDKDNVNAIPPDFVHEYIDDLLVKRVIEIAGNNAANTDLHMLEKAKMESHLKSKKDRQGEIDKMVESMSLNNISNHADTREAVLLSGFIKLKTGAEIKDTSLFISSNNSISTQYARILELDFHAKFSYKQLKKTETKNIPALVINYVYSLLSLLRILEIYNNDFVIGYRFSAYTHFHLAQFLDEDLDDYIRDFPVDINLKDELDFLLGEGSYSSLNKNYHFKMAKDLFEKAIRLHSYGTEYKNMINGMLYLEDDFNDNSYHFGAAMDRYLMINNVFDLNIEECKKSIINFNPAQFFNDVKSTSN
ncbi:hypothetical protein KXD93_14030 [Mucilaginibacter sp. BJC16-A38]|uniref:P-loop NTPase fold protein n=1 Tax=Mucilaginibacter phenanthrenivorans TaxID=1234842 RepID=UPI002157ED8B|nr:P-loop NTPase fold protein [Mucilaginibacter phenanthrenivorans]MCR8558772.1 hypothetical protein [Mucilaginibacter phenanthrenivorans]